MLTHFFIKRPIFSTVIALLIFCLGVVTYSNLPVELFPNVVPPTVNVSATFIGASAEDVVNSVAIPIENEINGVENMIYMESKSTNNGNYSLTVTFNIGTDPDMATTLVQNRVSRATASLPEAVTKVGVTTLKRSPNIVAVVSLYDRIEYAANQRRLEKVQSKVRLEHHEHKKSLLARLLETLGSITPSHESGTTGDESLKDWNYNEKGEIVHDKTGEIYTPRSGIYLANYAKTTLQDELARLKGVGDVTLFDTQLYSMRVWLDNDRLAARNLSASDIVNSINAQNRMIPAGRVGAAPAPDGQQTNIVLTVKGRLIDAAEFEKIVVLTDKEGRTLHLGDVATIERASESYLMAAELNGMHATSLGITQSPGNNAIQIADAIQKKLDEIRDELMGHGLASSISYDSTQFVRVSIQEVLHTLIEAVFIVVFIVYIFLQNWRAAIIPTLTVPISLVGAFFLMSMFGFTLNTLTLFGLVLVIGIVVDDSILVVENTQRILDENSKKTPYEAAKQSMDEMTSPIIGTTIVLMAVFIPTAMISGMTGQLYKQFALTIASAIGISGICALTFAPALSCIMLRPEKHEETATEKKRNPSPKMLCSWIADIVLATIFAHLVLHMFGFEPPLILLAAVAAALFCPLVTSNGRPLFFNLFNRAFDSANGVYVVLMRNLAKVAVAVLLFWGVLVYGLSWAFTHLPTGFLPTEDQGALFFEITLPEGASDERTKHATKKVRDIIEENRDGISNVIMITGRSMLQDSNQVNCAMGFIVLEHWSKRGEGLRADDIKNRLMQALSVIPDASATLFDPPPISGIGTSGGLELRLLDKNNLGSIPLAGAGGKVIEEALASKNVVFGQALFNPNAPRYFLNIDREKMLRLKLSPNDVFNTLSTLVGSNYVNDYNEFNQVYRVIVQAKGVFRNSLDPILDMQVRNANGNMVNFRSFATVENQMGPETITRFNQYQTNPIMLVPMPGRSSGQAIQTVEDICKEMPDYGCAWTGMTFQEKSVGAEQYVIFAMSIVFAFFILSALYESWSLPMIIMMAVPLGVAGALTAIALFGMPVNLYTQVGLIIMVGLSAKNAILITEVAHELRVHEKMSVSEAAISAGHRRMRPIMMTSYAFILGVIPLAIASGAGALGRNAIGRAVCGGMLNETMIGIFVTPALFILFQMYSEWFAKTLKKLIGETGNDGS